MTECQTNGKMITKTGNSDAVMSSFLRCSVTLFTQNTFEITQLTMVVRSQHPFPGYALPITFITGIVGVLL